MMPAEDKSVSELINIPQHTVIQYVRDRHNIPRGVIIAIKTDDGYRLGYSLCNKNDQFSKYMALKIAIGRAEMNSDDISVLPRPIAKMMPAFIVRCDKYYKTRGWECGKISLGGA